MHLISRLRRGRLACERGFTTVALMGVLMIGGLLVVAGFAAVDPDISLSREDQDKKQAYGAAESGLQWYLNSLSKDNNYYLKCTQVPPPNATEAAPVNEVWTGTGTRVWRKLPGEQAAVHGRAAPGAGQGRGATPRTSTRWWTRSATCASARPGARAASTGASSRPCAGATSSTSSTSPTSRRSIPRRTAIPPR